MTMQTAGPSVSDPVMSASVARYREFPVVFPAGQEEIYGIYVEPVGFAHGSAVVLVTGGGHDSMMQRNRMWTHLARRLAGAGTPVLRFDYHGVGESTGRVHDLQFSLDHPFVQDLEGAIAWLREQGISRLVMVGACYGARTILAAAERLPELQAAVLLSVPLRGHRWGQGAAERLAEQLTLKEYVQRAGRPRVVRRLMDPVWRGRYLRILAVKVRATLNSATALLLNRTGQKPLWWVSRKFLEPLQYLIDRRVPLLLLYGSEEEFYHEFQQAMAGDLGDIVRQADGVFEVRTIEGVLHGFTTVELQQAANDATFDWIRSQLHTEMKGGAPR